MISISSANLPQKRPAGKEAHSFRTSLRCVYRRLGLGFARRTEKGSKRLK
jgi:hypothetical protein